MAFPFLMKVYEDYAHLKIIDKTVFIEILELIQSFVWRRSILALPSNALNKIFMTLYDKVDHSQYLYSIQKSLLQRSGNQCFPKDHEVIDALKTKDMYNIKFKKSMYLLDRLENFKNKECVDMEELSIEHIFPQNPDP